MPYRFLDNIATSDAAFEARGSTLEELFLSAWDATLKTMVENPQSINMKLTRSISITGDQPDLLLHDFLQKLIFYKDAESELLMVKKMKLMSIDNQYEIRAQLAGETIDPSRHHMSVDVKAVTFHRLSVVELESGWSAIVVLDV